MVAINKTSTLLYDSLIDHITEISKKQENLKRLVNIIRYINEKNSDTLDTNIVGYSLLINEKDQDNILNCLDLTKKELKDLCLKSDRLTGIGKVIDQFSFALPLLILSGVLKKQNKVELSQGIFLFCFYRPYASKVTTYFTLGTVDERAMEYTTMVELDNKSYIHKFGSVRAVLTESAKSAYAAFIDDLAGKHGSPTDDLIFNNIFYSAIFGKTNSWLKSLYGTYKMVKSTGKALGYESGVYSTNDDETGDDNYEENAINSNSAAKRNVVAKAISKFNMSPINSKLVVQSAAIGYGGYSKTGEQTLIQILNQIAESKNELIPKYFDAIVGSFLDSTDINDKKNLANEIPTAKFLAYSKRIFKTSNTINSNIREEQNTTEEILVSCCPKYCLAEIKTKRKIKLTLFMYFVLFIQTA